MCFSRVSLSFYAAVVFLVCPNCDGQELVAPPSSSPYFYTLERSEKDNIAVNFVKWVPGPKTETVIVKVNRYREEKRTRRNPVPGEPVEFTTSEYTIKVPFVAQEEVTRNIPIPKQFSKLYPVSSFEFFQINQVKRTGNTVQRRPYFMAHDRQKL